MHQSGVLAAMCMYALDYHIDRLAVDYNLAEFLGKEIARLSKVNNVLSVETNIVIFDMKDHASTAIELVELLQAEGFLIGAFGERHVRIVIHITVDLAAGTRLMEVLSGILEANAE